MSHHKSLPIQIRLWEISSYPLDVDALPLTDPILCHLSLHFVFSVKSLEHFPVSTLATWFFPLFTCPIQEIKVTRTKTTRNPWQKTGKLLAEIMRFSLPFSLTSLVLSNRLSAFHEVEPCLCDPERLIGTKLYSGPWLKLGPSHNSSVSVSSTNSCNSRSCHNDDTVG